MERRGEPKGFHSESTFNTEVCEEDLNDDEQLPYHQFSQDRQKASVFSMNPGRSCRLAAVILALLAALLLVINIALGLHYHQVTESHLSLEETQLINSEMAKLEDTYKSAIHSMKTDEKELVSETRRELPTKWELEHLAKRNQDYKANIDHTTEEVARLRTYLPMMDKGCRHCPQGWIFLNSMCFYFALTETAGVKSWQKAREFCQLQNGDLAIIDSRDKENATLTHLRNHIEQSQSSKGFWIGLRDVKEEGTWRWLDESLLLEGYWKDGEPNNNNNADCAAMYVGENLFKAWKDNKCTDVYKWICEKTPINS